MFLTDYFREGVLDVGAETDRFLLSAKDSGSFGKTFARYHGAANVPALQCKSEVGSLDKVSVITRTPFRLCRDSTSVLGRPLLTFTGWKCFALT
jgi:hypothetical protein